MVDWEVEPSSTDIPIFLRRLDALTIANSGSVGLPFDQRASYALVENATVTIRRVEYEVELEVQELRTNRYPHAEWLTSIVRTARYYPPF